MRRGSVKSLLLDLNPTINNVPLHLKNVNSNEININDGTKSGSESFPKICLREKKRERQHNGSILTPNLSPAASSVYSSVISIGAPLDKNRWRHSSTTILDSLYKNLSKDIPTIDDVCF